MMVQFIERKLFEKSTHHREELSRLEAASKEQPLSDRVVVLGETPQLKFMNTILQDIDTSAEDFIFYFDRLAALIVEQWVSQAEATRAECSLTICSGRSTTCNSQQRQSRPLKDTSIKG